MPLLSLVTIIRIRPLPLPRWWVVLLPGTTIRRPLVLFAPSMCPCLGARWLLSTARHVTAGFTPFAGATSRLGVLQSRTAIWGLTSVTAVGWPMLAISCVFWPRTLMVSRRHDSTGFSLHVQCQLDARHNCESWEQDVAFSRLILLLVAVNSVVLVPCSVPCHIVFLMVV